MRRIVRHRPSPAMVVACLALAIALGGTSYAAVSLPKNSVGTKQLRNNAVTSAKVKKNALTGADILESRLGRVPSATSALNATNAVNAGAASGLPGPLGSGQTLRGAWGLAGHKTGNGFPTETEISFQIPLAAEPNVSVLPPGGPPTAACPGSYLAPSAVAGRLCVYMQVRTGNIGLGIGLSTRFGFSIYPTNVPNDSDFEAFGTWAVTAP
jgi:hypothetical protein